MKAPKYNTCLSRIFFLLLVLMTFSIVTKEGVFLLADGYGFCVLFNAAQHYNQPTRNRIGTGAAECFYIYFIQIDDGIHTHSVKFVNLCLRCDIRHFIHLAFNLFLIVLGNWKKRRYF